MAITISLCMIVRDEEQVLGRCLGCASRFADEIVVVDTGSADRTREVARAYTSLVFDFPWADDFSAARNFSFSKATCDYILWLDADDVVDEENIARIRKLKETLPSDVDAVLFHYNTGFDEQGAVTFRYYRERLVRRSRGFRWREPVHEYLEIGGKLLESDIAVTHGHKDRGEGLSTRNLRIYQGLVDRGEPLSTRGMYYFARELFTHGRHREAAELFEAFLRRPDGWVEDRITACAGLADALCLLGEPDRAMEALALSFALDTPRAEILCRMGKLRMDRGEDAAARYWYGLALEAPRPGGWGFVSEDYWGYIPHVQLCLLLDRAGQPREAFRHHLAARRIRPGSAAVRHNDAYFAGLGMDPEGEN